MNNEIIKESVTLRGICAALQSMSFPKFSDLSILLEKFGYKLTKKE